MANWKHRISIGDLFNDDGSLSVRAIGQAVAERVKAEMRGTRHWDEELADIVCMLESEEHTVDADELDYVLDQLYDWADREHRLWINTFDWEVTNGDT